MTDVEVMKNMNHCIKGECSQCGYEHGGQCKESLMRDANCIMKMQHDTLKGLREALDQAEEKLRWLPKGHQTMTEADFVRRLNELIADCYGVDWVDDEHCDSDYVRMLGGILGFSTLLPSKHKVVIEGLRKPPKLVLVKD